MVISKETSLLVAYNSQTDYMKIIALLVASGALILVFKERKKNRK